MRRFDYKISSKGNSVPNLVTSVNGMTGDVSIGGVGGLTCYVNPIDGNDSTAEVGNVLRPFQTIHGAVNAVPYGGAIEIQAGVYYEDDSTLPMGLLLHSYDIYFLPNAILNYYGTYGLYLNEAWKEGNIFGYGQINLYAPNYSNPYGYAIYVEISTKRKFIEVNHIRQEYDSSDTDADLIRIGTCWLTAVTFSCYDRFLSRRGVAMRFDSGSRVTVSSPVFGAVQALRRPAVMINDCIHAIFTNCTINGYGTKFARYQPVLIEITFGYSSQIVTFNNCTIYFNDDTNGFKVIQFLNGTASYPTAKITIKNCVILNSQEPNTPGLGSSIYSDHNINLRIVDTYAGRATAGLGKITNLIKEGNKLMIDSQMKI